MKAVLIMKNGMSIDLDNPELVIINGVEYDDMDEIISVIPTLDHVKMTHVKSDKDGKVHTFKYQFSVEAYNWGYSHYE